jgi:hypothetical protein
MGISENEVRKRAVADRLEINSVGSDQSHDAGLDESAWVSWRLPNLEISRHLGLI